MDEEDFIQPIAEHGLDNEAQRVHQGEQEGHGARHDQNNNNDERGRIGENRHDHGRIASLRANEVEDDEEDDRSIDNILSGGMSNRNSPIPILQSLGSKAIIVPLSHPPEAVKLLLEYCYTNRVISLGYEAFIKSFKPIDPNTMNPIQETCIGPVCPFPKVGSESWPNDGLPTISLAVSLAGIQLAEEAKLPRLSLMCEIAASKLITSHTVLESLAFCEVQYRATGNRLLILRKAAMLYHILGHGPKGVAELANMPSFRRTLEERNDFVVPSLLMGIKEIVHDLLGRGANCVNRDGPSKSQAEKIILSEFTKHYFEQ